MGKAAIERDKKRKEARQRKRAAMAEPGFMSKYARKHAYCVSRGVWGWECPQPKPWGSSS